MFCKLPVEVTVMRFLSEKEVSELLKIRPTTLRAWRCRGRGPRFVKAGGRVLYPVSELERFIGYKLEPAKGEELSNER